LASELQCHPQGLELLLRLLVSAGYLRQRRERYRNSHMARRWLLHDSPTNIAPYVIHSPDIAALWEHLPRLVRTNQQMMRMPYEEDTSSPETQRLLARHYAGLASLALALGDEIIHRVRLPAGAQYLLDVGGSHAGFSALFCRHYSHLHATVLDLQPGIEAGQRTAAQLHLEERISFIGSDIVRDDFPTLLATDYDVALYFHIAHLLPADVNQAVLAKVVRALRPGGQLIFLDQVTDQTHGSHLSSLMVQFMALTVRTIGGTCYPFPTVKKWLEKLGMTRVRAHRLLTPGASLITAVKR
ncbi:MAG: class I SAM-dependent methyltransferase, partial [Ktedonobacteraceae bacterium]|nr:class I SAM-dependent methyltransferase [Ktedonobacteraceae bacterium]